MYILNLIKETGDDSESILQSIVLSPSDSE